MTTRDRPAYDGGWVTSRDLVEASILGLVDLPDPLPTLLCKGLCSESCGPAPMTPVEFDRVQTAIGRPLVVHADTLRCSALNNEGRCDAYNGRPLVCRLWGMSEGMMCSHGCVTTTGEYVTYAEAQGLFARAAREEGEHVVPSLE